MNKRKTREFIHIILVFLCLFPLLCTLFTYFRTPPENPNAILQTIQDQWCISNDLKFVIKDAFSAFGVSVNHPVGTAMCAIMANTLMIYVAYLFVEVMLFIPKFALRLLGKAVDI